MNKGRGFKVTGVQGDEKSEIPRTPQPDDFDGDMEKYLDALNQHMKDVEQSIEKDPADDPKYTGDAPFDIEDPLTVGDDNATQYNKVQQG